MTPRRSSRLHGPRAREAYRTWWKPLLPLLALLLISACEPAVNPLLGDYILTSVNRLSVEKTDCCAGYTPLSGVLHMKEGESWSDTLIVQFSGPECEPDCRQLPISRRGSFVFDRTTDRIVMVPAVGYLGPVGWATIDGDVLYIGWPDSTHTSYAGITSMSFERAP